MGFRAIEPVQITGLQSGPADFSLWNEDINLTSFTTIPAPATAVLFYIVNDSSNSWVAALRHANNSANIYSTGNFAGGRIAHFIATLEGSSGSIFDFYTQVNTSLKFFIGGFFHELTVFEPQNRISSSTSTNSWQTKTINEVPTGTTYILNATSVNTTVPNNAWREVGGSVEYPVHGFISFIKLNSNKQFEVNVTSSNLLDIWGYTNKNWVQPVATLTGNTMANTTWSANSTWNDFPITYPNKTGVLVFQDDGWNAGYSGFLRKKGSSWSIARAGTQPPTSFIVEPDSSGVFQYWIESANPTGSLVVSTLFAETVPDYTLTDVNTTESVVAGQNSVVFSGRGLSTVDKIRIASNTRSISKNVTSANLTTVIASIPTDSELFSSNVAFGNITFSVEVSGNAVANLSGTLALSEQYGQHDVINVSQNTNSNTIYFAQIPAVKVGDKIAHDSITKTYGWGATIDSNGFISVGSSYSTQSDNLSYRIYSTEFQEWSTPGTVVLQSPYINARTDSSRVAKSADGKRYSKYPDGNIMAQTSMQSSISQYGITWTFDAAYPVGQYVTGDYFVVGSPTITTIIPAMTEDDANGTNRRNGSRKNPAPEEYTAWDSRTSNFTTGGANTTNIDKVPITLIPGDSLISTISKTTNTVIDVSGHATTQVFLTDSAVLTCVSSVPFVDSFRPAYVSVSGKANFRASQIDSSWLNVLYPVGGEPSLSEIASRFARPWTASHIRDFVGRGSQPSNNMSSYYEYVAYDYGLAMLLMLTNTSANKTSLINGFVQESIDHYYCTKDHEANSSTNKAPILFAAKLLGATDWIANISSGAMTHPWREDTQTYYWADKQSANSSSIVTAGQVWTGYTPPVFWRQDPGNNEHEHLHPSEWNVVANGGGDKREDYRWSSVSQTWPALYLPLLISNLDGDFGHLPWAEYVDRWMTENMVTQEAIIQSYYPSFNGVYKTSGYAWIDLMWSTYRGNY
jgi:hypothetical protein